MTDVKITNSAQDKDEFARDLHRTENNHTSVTHFLRYHADVADDLMQQGYLKLSKGNTVLQERIAKTIHQFSLNDEPEAQDAWGEGLNKDGCKFCMSRALILIHDMLGLPDPDADELETEKA